MDRNVLLPIIVSLLQTAEPCRTPLCSHAYAVLPR